VRLIVALALSLLASPARAQFDVNGITLGATEHQVKAVFPQANCRALEWSSRAAERRCDDSRIRFAGIDASVTLYLRRDAVEGIDVRFGHHQREAVAKFMRERYGTPGPREWKSRSERTRLAAGQSNRRASLLVWRGDFEQELYKIR
jgi:hypothetical protein